VRSAWLLGVFALAYVAIVVPHLGPAYIDFGDGNYLYISRRLADGVVLYRDILAPQPPCHLLLGSLLVRLGRWLGHGAEAELYTVRAFSILLHLATMVLVWALGLRLFRRRGAALWAAGLYLVIPIGFWWTLGYQSEPLEMFFLLASFLLVLRWRRWSLAAAGVLAALAISTNMTAVPYVGWVGLFLLAKEPRRALWYVVPAAVAAGLAVAAGEWFSGGHYLENVFFNQVGTFPDPDLMGRYPPGAPLRKIRTVLAYGFSKIAREGSDVMALEGVFVGAAVAGLLLYLRGGPSADETPGDSGEVPYHRSFVGWYAFWSFLAICFVAKGATEDYIFTIGEPFVCLFAAYAITDLGDRAFGENGAFGGGGRSGVGVLRLSVAAVGLVVLFGRPALWIYNVVWEQGAYELRASEVEKIRFLIERNSRPDEPILAPPYYAFLARRTLYEDYSELFIWQIKYLLEQKVEKTTGPATLKVRSIARALRERRIAVVVVNKDPATRQIYSIPSVREAIDRNYRSLLRRPIRTLNTLVDVLVPVEGRPRGGAEGGGRTG